MRTVGGRWWGRLGGLGHQQPGLERLGTTTSFGFDPGSRPANEVQAGDDILCKRVAPPA